MLKIHSKNGPDEFWVHKATSLNKESLTGIGIIIRLLLFLAPASTNPQAKN